MTTRKQIYDIERKYVRARAYPRQNKFNNYNGGSWCGYFQEFCLKKGGLGKWVDKFSNFSYCPAIMKDAKKMKCWYKRPKRGDLILFDWDRNGVPNHIGFLVKKTEKGLYKTVEGNTSSTNNSNGNCVQIRYRNPKDVIGFVRPPYDKPKKKKKTGYPELKKGSHGAYVKILQKKLKITTDGVFGSKTEKAVKTFQKKHKLKVDGVVGKKTWTKLMG